MFFRYRYRLPLCMLLILAANAGLGQQADTLWLPETQVKSYRYTESPDYLRSWQADSGFVVSLQYRDLGQWLDHSLPLYLKSYGPGNLSTVSLRGMNAVHSSMRWNGLLIQGPMNGLYDLSLIPVFLLGSGRVEFASGLQQGSGAVGGVIQMNSTSTGDSSRSAEVLLSAGSFGLIRTGLGFGLGQGKWSSDTRIYHQQSTNDFDYTNIDGEILKMTDSDSYLSGISHQSRIRTGITTLLLNAWLSESQRGIGPHRLQETNDQEQSDNSFRISAESRFSTIKSEYVLLAGYNSEQIRFEDPARKLDELTDTRFGEFSASSRHFAGDRFSIKTRLSWQYGTGKAEAYAGKKYSSRPEAGVILSYSSNRFDGEGGISGGAYNGSAYPLQYSLTGGWNIHSLRIFGALASVYRLPTLNDLYWNPGGNPDLTPESGSSYSAGLQWNKQNSRWGFSVSPSFFYILLDERIVWLPADNGIYSARNTGMFTSRGAELSASVDYTTTLWQGSLKGSLQYNQSEDGSNPGEQSIYSPEWIVRTSLEIQLAKYQINLYQGFTSERFVTSDHSQQLDAFGKTDLNLARKIRYKSSDFLISLLIENITNAQYEMIAWRPMPGRSFCLSFSAVF